MDVENGTIQQISTLVNGWAVRKLLVFKHSYSEDTVTPGGVFEIKQPKVPLVHTHVAFILTCLQSY